MKQITYRKKCNYCSNGEMVLNAGYDANCYSNSNGTHYPHKCKSCGIPEYFLNESYPKQEIEYEDHEKEDIWV